MSVLLTEASLCLREAGESEERKAREGRWEALPIVPRAIAGVTGVPSRSLCGGEWYNALNDFSYASYAIIRFGSFFLDARVIK